MSSNQEEGNIDTEIHRLRDIQPREGTCSSGGLDTERKLKEEKDPRRAVTALSSLVYIFQKNQSFNMKLKSLTEGHIKPDRYIEGRVVYFLFNILFCGVFMTVYSESKHFFTYCLYMYGQQTGTQPPRIPMPPKNNEGEFQYLLLPYKISMTLWLFGNR